MEFYFSILFINAIICTYCIFKNAEETFSLHKIVHIFVLIFFVTANALQFYSGTNVTSLRVVFSPDDYVFLQAWILIILLIYNILYTLIKNRTTEECVVSTYSVSTNRNLLVYLSLISFALIIFQYYSNLRLLFFRGVVDEIVERRLEGSLSLIFEKFIRPIPFVCYMISKLTDSENKINKLLFGLMLISICPTGLSRNAVAMYWIPVSLVNFRILYKKYVFTGCLLFGIFIVFPFLDSFRHYSGVLRTNFSFDYLISMNFDASQMMMIVQKWDIVTWGKQLLGVIFFFIPRSLWPNKAVGSGHYIADLQGAFPNVSMPFWGEGYINFGSMGIIVFTIVLAVFTAILDRKFWREEVVNDNSNPGVGLYMIMVGALVYILRGDLLSSVAYSFGTLLSYYLIQRLTVKKEEVCE